jgi:hypothetical protein
MPKTEQRITPFLWFDDDAEEARAARKFNAAGSRTGSGCRKKIDIATLKKAYEGRPAAAA